MIPKPEHMRFRNHYACPECGTHWNDVWDSMCDDPCPKCDTACTPETSEDLWAPKLRGELWDVFEANGILEIERVDSPDVDAPPFDNDGDAVVYVMDQACRGDSEEARNAIREIAESWLPAYFSERATELLKEAVAYQAEQLDGPPDVPCDISGADTIDWLSEWRKKAKELLAEVEPPRKTYKVHLHQYREWVAEVSVEATDIFEARAKAERLGKDDEVDWEPGDDAGPVETYRIYDPTVPDAVWYK